jgi:hypothetical protein
MSGFYHRLRAACFRLVLGRVALRQAFLRILKAVHPTDVPYSWCVIDLNR